MIEYTFREQIDKGKQAEARLDEWFSTWYEIKQIPLEVERVEHFDRIFIRDGQEMRVEYKTDFQAHQTGNAFIETYSNIETNKPGWIYSSQADILVYFIPEAKSILIVRMMLIRMCIRHYLKVYRKRKCKNVNPNGSNYHSEGVLVPIRNLIPLGKMHRIE